MYLVEPSAFVFFNQSSFYLQVALQPVVFKVNEVDVQEPGVPANVASVTCPDTRVIDVRRWSLTEIASSIFYLYSL